MDFRNFKEPVEIKKKAAGYQHGDLLYTLLFMNTDHLPEVRITPRGIFDVKQGKLLTAAKKLT